MSTDPVACGRTDRRIAASPDVGTMEIVVTCNRILGHEGGHIAWRGPGQVHFDVGPAILSPELYEWETES